MVTTVKADDIDFSSEKSTAVISGAQKFILPVPKFEKEDGGEELKFPAGHEKAGEQITDWENKPIGDRGIVFKSGEGGKESIGGVAGDGNGVVIMNQATEEQAAKIFNKIEAEKEKSGVGSIEDLSVKQFKEVLDYARSEEVGLTDIYNSDKGFIDKKMSRAGKDTDVEAYGLFKRDDRDVSQAVYVEGKDISFQGNSQAAGGEQSFPDGAVFVKQGDEVRGIDPKRFEETYKHADGRPLKVSELSQPEKSQSQESGAEKPIYGKFTEQAVNGSGQSLGGAMPK